MTWLGVLYFSVALCRMALVESTPPPRASSLRNRQLILPNAYAPVQTSCPSTPLVRFASGISSDETSYFASRKAKADKSLATWLQTQGNFDVSDLPALAMAASGGGYRAMLLAAGVVQAFDDRDSDSATNGLFQALTYQAGLSGGAWFLGSFAGHNWPTVSQIAANYWAPAFQNSLLLPDNLLGTTQYVDIALDVAAKVTAAFPATIVDAWGRLLSYQFLPGNGGNAMTLSGLATMDNFTSYDVPFPIITALEVDHSYWSECFAGSPAAQYEFTPYEYGSWDENVQAFARSEYMGTDMTEGQPTDAGKCVTNYDNIGYIFGTSSDIFTIICAGLQTLTYDWQTLSGILEKLAGLTQMPTFMTLTGVFQNPFFKLDKTTTEEPRKLITMQDGGSGGRNIPIWPFIQPARSVDVLITCDNGADMDNFSNGTDLRQTYLQAQAAGLNKMPYIPDTPEYVAKGLDKRATFFGCDTEETILIINLPNFNYTFPSNQNGLRIQYSEADTMGMIENGGQIALQGGASDWPLCLACGIKYKDGISKLPAGCGKCFEKYCYNS